MFKWILAYPYTSILYSTEENKLKLHDKHRCISEYNALFGFIFYFLILIYIFTYLNFHLVSS